MEKNFCVEVFDSLYKYYLLNKTSSNRNIWIGRENIYRRIVAYPEIRFEHLLRLIILAAALRYYKKSIYGLTDIIIAEKRGFTFLYNEDPIYDFCMHYKERNDPSKNFKYTKLFRDVNDYLKVSVIWPMNISEKTFVRHMYREDLTVDRLAAICLCLNMDVFLTGELMRRAGFMFSPYSPDAKTRAIYSLFCFSPEITKLKKDSDTNPETNNNSEVETNIVPDIPIDENMDDKFIQKLLVNYSDSVSNDDFNIELRQNDRKKRAPNKKHINNG